MKQYTFNVLFENGTSTNFTIDAFNAVDAKLSIIRNITPLDATGHIVSIHRVY